MRAASLVCVILLVVLISLLVFVPAKADTDVLLPDSELMIVVPGTANNCRTVYAVGGYLDDGTFGYVYYPDSPTSDWHICGVEVVFENGTHDVFQEGSGGDQNIKVSWVGDRIVFGECLIDECSIDEIIYLIGFDSYNIHIPLVLR